MKKLPLILFFALIFTFIPIICFAANAAPLVTYSRISLGFTAILIIIYFIVFKIIRKDK